MRTQGLAVVLLICLVLFVESVIAEQNPNFLFILTDDQAQQTLGCYGNETCQTPNIDQIAKSGIRILDAHHMGAWSGAVCLPSRTMIMTGKSVWRIPNFQPRNTTKNEFQKVKWKLGVEAAKSSIPALFNAAGYDTFRTCKAGNTFKQANKLFDETYEKDMRQGTDEHGSKWHADHVIGFLDKRQAEQGEDPFFIFMGFSHPHDPRNGTPELLQKYNAENLKEPPKQLNPKAPPLPVNYLPQHPFHHGHPGLRDEVNVPGVLKDRSEATVRNEIGREYACIENIDNQIGRVIDKLTEMGELENTYVIYTADHGMSVGRHGLMGKQNLYEHTFTVPFLVSGPGIQAGSTASGFIYLMDILPTLCDLAGIESPDGIDGQSFKSILFGEQDRIRDLVYGVYCGGTKPGMRAVKTADNWKLIKYDVLDGYVRETQLFDLNTNPNEFLDEHKNPLLKDLCGCDPNDNQRNLAHDSQFSARRRTMEDLLRQQMKKYSDPYALWDQ